MVLNCTTRGEADLLVMVTLTTSSFEREWPGRCFTHRTRRGRRFDFHFQSKFKKNMPYWCQEYQKMRKLKSFREGSILLYNLHWVTGTFSWIPLPWEHHFLNLLVRTPPWKILILAFSGRVGIKLTYSAGILIGNQNSTCVPFWCGVSGQENTNSQS